MKRHTTRHLAVEFLECKRMFELNTKFDVDGFNVASTISADEQRGTTMAFLGPEAAPTATVVAGFRLTNENRVFYTTGTESADLEMVIFNPDGQVNFAAGVGGSINYRLGLADSRIAAVKSYTLGGIQYLLAAGYTEVSGSSLAFKQITLQIGNFAVYNPTGRDFAPEDKGGFISILDNPNSTVDHDWRPGVYEITDTIVDTATGRTLAILDQDPTDGFTDLTGGNWALQSDDNEDSRPSTDMFVGRWIYNGNTLTLDPSYGAEGFAIYPIASGFNNFDYAYALDVDSAFRAVVVGYSQSPALGDYDFSVMRLQTNGKLDTTFNQTGTQGKLRIAITSNDDFANAVDVNADGNIMLAGSSGSATNPRATFVKLSATGNLVTTFGDQGISKILTSVAGNSFINDIEEYPAGAAGGLGGFYVAVGTVFASNRNTVLMRISDETGLLDTTFGTNGAVRADLGGGKADWGNSVALQPTTAAVYPPNSYGVVIGGSADRASGNYDMYVARYKPDGSPDVNFNQTSNLFFIDFDDPNTSADDKFVQYGATVLINPFTNLSTPASNTILISGSAQSNATPINFDFAIAAVIGDPDAQVNGLVSVLNQSVVEGDSGSPSINFTLQLDKASSTDTKVRVKTRNGSAKAGTDYVTRDTVVTIPAGQTTQTFTVKIYGNTEYQASRSFAIELSDPVGLAIDQGTAMVTIFDNDGTWQNVVNPFDVKADKSVGPEDLITLVEDLSEHGSRQLSQALTTPSSFCDINGDTQVTPADLVALVEYLEEQQLARSFSIVAQSAAASRAAEESNEIDDDDANFDDIAAGVALSEQETSASDRALGVWASAGTLAYSGLSSASLTASTVSVNSIASGTSYYLPNGVNLSKLPTASAVEATSEAEDDDLLDLLATDALS